LDRKHCWRWGVKKNGILHCWKRSWYLS
jgi:hypothetical protein